MNEGRKGIEKVDLIVRGRELTMSVIIDVKENNDIKTFGCNFFLIFYITPPTPR